MAGWAFFASACLYLLRINFSIAIVCMTYDEKENETGSVNGSSVDPGYMGSLRSVIYGHGYSVSEEVCPNNITAGPETGEFTWDRELRGLLSSSFFWGYVLTQFPGGWISQIIGGKRLITVGMSISIVMSLLSPPAARLSPYALAAARFINGLGQGVYFPSLNMMLGYWFPLSERAFLLCIAGTGATLGSVLSFALSGYLCAQVGWPWIFYVYSILSVVWLVCWVLFVYDTPSVHPRISDAEKKFLEANVTARDKNKLPPIPWRPMLVSPLVWSLALVDFCTGWAFYAGLTQLPQYMEDVLEFDITQNGLYSSLPGLIRFIMSYIFALLGDFILNLHVMQVLTLRRIASSVALLLPMVCVIGVGYLDCNTAALAIVLLVLQEGLNAAAAAGYPVSKVDIAPQFSGVITGICNTSANIAGIFAPMAIGFITKDGTREQWQLCFLMSALMYLVAWLSYMIFGKSDVQEWAKTDDDCSHIDLEIKEDLNDSEKKIPPAEYSFTEEVKNPQCEITHM